MVNEKVAALLNQQINKEFFSSYFYLAISNYYTKEGLEGFANWYHIQAQEEKDHAILFMQYMQNNDLDVTLEAVEKPKCTFKDFKTPLEEGLAHERYVTKLINTIYDAAHEDKDYRTMQFLDWFIKEQGEEETSADSLVKKMELFGSDPRGLYLLDTELAARVYQAPTLNLAE